MLSTLLTSLTALREFFSRSFFVAAFIPALFFVFANVALLYSWSWAAHDWLDTNVLGASGWRQAVVFAALFFLVWIVSYLIASLTPLWIRTLEGRNWYDWFARSGVSYHVATYQALDRAIEEAVRIHGSIRRDRPTWEKNAQDAVNGQYPTSPPLQKTTAQWIRELREKKSKDELITFAEVEALANAFAQETANTQNSAATQQLAEDVTSLITYAEQRSISEQVRVTNERNREFSDQENTLPTRFGNVGLTAHAYALRAFGCNLTSVWNVLQKAISKDATASTALANTKSQLDFLVAGFWVTLTLGVTWAFVFAADGLLVAALVAAIGGPLVCWSLWYGALVEQQRVLQDLIISILNQHRFHVFTEFHLGLPMDLPEERALWEALDLAIGRGDRPTLRYEHPKPV